MNGGQLALLALILLMAAAALGAVVTGVALYVRECRKPETGDHPVQESQYIDAYLALTADPATRYTPWTYLRYTIHGTAWSLWSRGYYDALMRAIGRRVKAGTVQEVPSKGGSVAYAWTDREGAHP